MSAAKMTEAIEMPFWFRTHVGPRNHVLDGGPDLLCLSSKWFVTQTCHPNLQATLPKWFVAQTSGDH